ncbi:MAG: phospholipase [Muribaculaceae bacterium]|nr:phospholipase [Muribaculaceae bacterium]
MIVALILLAALVAVGLPLYLLHRRDFTRNPSTPDDNPPVGERTEECCGLHLTCDKGSLLAIPTDHPVYYDDEELDRHAGARTPDDYSPEEEEEFRDILLTMLPDDVPGWVRSLRQRGIPLPTAVREEVLLIVNESRSASAQK